MAKINVINKVNQQPAQKVSGESPHAKKHTAWLIGGIVFVVLMIAAIGYVLMTSDGPVAGQAVFVKDGITLVDGDIVPIFTDNGKQYSLQFIYSESDKNKILYLYEDSVKNKNNLWHIKDPVQTPAIDVKKG
ncbi:hypothetical protein HQ489_03155, partial [Candidatus Woesearchaeota archaeon]|nr:hypothetical protein [Candidatus Woesearchaeota archaeon]